jgi:hypothetical protein
MDEQEFLQEKQLQPTFTAAEIYAMLSVPDITRKEHIELIDLITKEGARYEQQELHWLVAKSEEVAAKHFPKVGEQLRGLYNRSKNKLNPPDDGYLDYEQSE